uniref:Uncharacterized protein n=1 Tax=Euplotes harpa TaxID=151035 RepID=A0A7S3N5F2_9SPIT|mmetsp:Transcript_23553/g.27020  ORF Transcript_23553/g.27020 Transcript_23553/m.27020 type:complete len:127 (+) Transcript_23553:334-714(+)
MKVRMLKAAEKRGLRIQNSSISPMNNTLTNFKSPQYMDQVDAKQNTHILVSDRVENSRAINDDPRYSSSNLPEFINKHKYAQKEGNREHLQKYSHKTSFNKTQNDGENFGFPTGQYQRSEHHSIHK